ncbi:MAG TPA: leucyl aminopeptidase [Candidatus Acidoferrales bacterium]|nr:leucyl aminopeptidase [Candidatus Acidoferrales bacterium]
MEISYQDSGAEKLATDLLVLPVREPALRDPQVTRFDRALKGTLSARIGKLKFTGSEGSFLLHATEGRAGAGHLLLAGLGKAGEAAADSWRRIGARAKKEAAALGADDVAFDLSKAADAAVTSAAVVEGALLASYQFNRYRSEDRAAPALKRLIVARPGLRRTPSLEKAVREAEEAARGVCLARDLVNEPPSVTTASYLGEQAVRHCRGRSVQVEVWNKKKIQAMNLAGLLAVNRGSAEEPRFIVIHYRPAGKAKKKIAVMGKGITFDSGGLSLKSARSMETMKLDMSGAAAIIGAMSVIERLHPPVEILAYIPCTDNLPSGSAQKPGDVIRYLNGKTAEVVNTDAEGRLILADALALAVKQKPDFMLTLATLTGACVVALGQEIAGVFGNHQPLVDAVMRAARDAGEKLWQLPLAREYREDIRSSIADIKNVGGSHGGAITAALFLHEFVDNVPWVHIDMAGPAFAEKETPLCPRGGTGFGVRTLLRFFTSFS